MLAKSRLLMLILALVMVSGLVLSGAPSPVEAQDPVVVTWYVGLGAGGQPEQVAAQEAVVEAFNSSRSDIQIELILVDNELAYDTLNTLIASNESPDIVGPVGIRGANAYEGSWLDLDPLVAEAGYDLSIYDPALVDFYRTEEGLTGLPFAVFPGAIFFNRDLFDAAGLDYPPQSYGEAYADGREWNADTLRDLAMQLTLDANGNNATSPDFDPANIVQYGYSPQWYNDDFRSLVTSPFGAGSFYDEASGSAVMPENWQAGLEWYYNAMWTDRFMPNSEAQQSDALANGNVFSSGNVAMSVTHLWYTCCTGNVANWDVAVVPSYNGVSTAKLHADTFRILEFTDTPSESFEVLNYLLNEAGPELLAVYGGLPADASKQDAFFAALDEQFTQGVNWDVFLQGQAYPDAPSHESWMPNFNEADIRVRTFQSLLQTTPDLDLAAEVELLLSDLQAIFDAAE